MIGLLWTSAVWAVSEHFIPTQLTGQPESVVRYRLPYTLGTHEGQVASLTGSLDWDSSTQRPIRGSFQVPISKLVSGGAALHCHLQEALGLNYAQSDYPTRHVCNDDQLPPTGKNAVSYPLIEFELKSVQCLGACTEAQVVGVWKIHGIQRESRFSVQVEKKEGLLRIRGETPLSLKDFGIQVKSAQVLFLTISVEDQVMVSFDLYFHPPQLRG